MHNYRKKVKLAASAKTGEPIYNGSIDHAEILTESLFANAQKDICILSGGLNPRVFGTDDVVEQARLFLANPEHTVRVLVEETSVADRDGHPFYDEFWGGKERPNIEFLQVPQHIKDIYEFHVIVADGDSYRFEKDKCEPVAIAAFGDKRGGENLQSAFEALWATGMPLAN